MKGNEFSIKMLRADAVEWLGKLHRTMVIMCYGKGSVRGYCQEMTLLFKYCNHKAVADINQDDVEQYMLYIKDVHKVGRAKCKSVAAACCFFFKHILPAPHILPAKLYSRKKFVLPNIILHLQKHTQAGVVSPLDSVVYGANA